MTDSITGGATGALRMAQSVSNPLVTVKHGRREDRAVAYDHFLTLCVSFHRSEDNEAASERVSSLYAALQAIELRAPRNVREAAQKLFWRIVGPIDSFGLMEWWMRPGPNVFPKDDGTDYDHDEWTDEKWEKHQREIRRNLWVPWRLSPLPHNYRSTDHGNKLSRFYSIHEFLEGVAEFTEVARVDVNGRWRWWHWPMSVIPQLKLWQLTR